MPRKGFKSASARSVNPTASAAYRTGKNKPFFFLSLRVKRGNLGGVTPSPAHSDLSPTRSDLSPTRSDLSPTRSDLSPTRSDLSPTRSEPVEECPRYFPVIASPSLCVILSPAKNLVPLRINSAWQSRRGSASLSCHSEPYSVILSAAKDLIFTQGKLREESALSITPPKPRVYKAAFSD